MTPTIAKKQRWAAEVAHVARGITEAQGLTIPAPGHKCSENEAHCYREARSAIEEGRLRLAVLLLASAIGASLDTLKGDAGYMALPDTPAEAIRLF